MSPLLPRRNFLAGAAAALGASLASVDLARALLPQQRAYLTSQAVDYIDVIAGQSNEIYGVPFTSGVDIGDPRFFQMFSGNEGTANKISNGGANDPLDNVDPTGITTPAIGNAVHFYRDWFVPNVNPRRVLFLPCAYGGTSVITTGSGAWGVSTAKGGAVGSLTTNMIQRVALARQLWPAAKLVFRFECIEQDTDGYTSLSTNEIDHFRAAYLDWILYVRAQFAAIGYEKFPIIIGRPTSYILTTVDSIEGGPNSWDPRNVVPADAIVRALYNRVPNVGIADSQSPTAATNQSSTPVHFDHNGQVTMAGRYWIAYQNAIGNTLFPTFPVWDTTDNLTVAAGYPSGFTLGSGGSTLSGDATSQWKAAFATCPSQPSTSSMLYAEVVATAVASSSNMMAGLANQATDLLYYLGGSTTNTAQADYSSAAYWGGQSSMCANGTSGVWSQASISCPNFSVGDVIQFALNRATGKAWFGHNGTWLGSGNPSSGSNPWLTGIPQSDMVFLAASIYTGTGNTFAIQGKASQFAYTPPSGFQPWGH